MKWLRPSRRGQRNSFVGTYLFDFAGFVADWTVLQIGDTHCACPDGGDSKATRTIDVEGLARWATETFELTLGWGEFLVGAEVVYLFGADGDYCYAYAFSVAVPQRSEWGYAPWRVAA